MKIGGRMVEIEQEEEENREGGNPGCLQLDIKPSIPCVLTLEDFLMFNVT